MAGAMEVEWDPATPIASPTGHMDQPAMTGMETLVVAVQGPHLLPGQASTGPSATLASTRAM